MRIKIEKKYVGIFILLIGFSIVLAANPGHVLTEIDPPLTCSSGQFLKYTTSSGWACETFSTPIPLNCFKKQYDHPASASDPDVIMECNTDGKTGYYAVGAGSSDSDPQDTPETSGAWQFYNVKGSSTFIVCCKMP